MSSLHFVLVPGFWEGPEIFRDVAASLIHQGYEVTTAPLVSTGKPASQTPKSPSMYDDIESIRKVILNLAEQGKSIVLVGHSAGGFLSSHATESLSEKERAAKGQTGGITKLAFISGALFPVGHMHGPAPFFQTQGDELHCQSPQDVLFNDAPADKLDSYVKMLSCQPASGWDNKIEYAGWHIIPSTYLVCEKDAAIPAPLQQQIAGMASCSPIESVEAGHCAPITQPEKVVAFLKKAVA